MDEFYVYVHIDPETQSPFYIGIGRGKRAFDKKRNQFWLDFVSEYSKDYQVDFIAKDISEELAQEIENTFIAKYGKAHNGKGCLLNWTDGGYAEGVFVQILPEFDRNIDKHLTTIGKKLIKIDVNSLDLSKIHRFLNEVIQNQSAKSREKLIDGILKNSTPRGSWKAPFYLTQKVQSNIEINIKASVREELIEDINKAIEVKNLPYRPFVDQYIFRISIYYDLLLQKHVWLEQNGVRISAQNSDWYFYKDYWKGYIKIIQAQNQGIPLTAKLLGKNIKDRNTDNIYDFEIFRVE